MAKKYSEEFKKNAVALLKEVKEKGFTMYSGTYIENVRDLCKILGISSYTLYKWRDEVKPKKIVNKTEVLENGEVKYDNTHLTKKVKTNYMRLGIGFFRDLAGGLGIKNYGNIPIAMLKLLIGKELIKQSGLVE